MKKLCAFLVLTALLVSTIATSPTITFASGLDAENDWTLFASEDFSGASDGDVNLYNNGGTGFAAGKWLRDTGTNTLSARVRNGKIDVDVNATNKGINMFRKLATPIDMTVDADYYISYDFNNLFLSSSYQRLGLINSKSSFTTDQIDFDAANSQYNKNAAVIRHGVNAAEVGADMVSAGNSTSLSNKLIDDGRCTGVIKISARATGEDTMLFRVFNANGQESPSFNPSYWDAEYKAPMGTPMKIDTIQYQFSNGTSTVPSEIIFDNLKIFKAQPVLVTSSDTSGGKLWPDTQLTINTIPATNALGNAQTLISQGWYDGVTMLSSGDTYTVPKTMAGKFLTAKVVVEDSVTHLQTTKEVFKQQVFYVPSDMKLLSRDDFTANYGTAMGVYSGGTGWDTPWTTDAAGSVPVVAPSDTTTPGGMISNNKAEGINKFQNSYRRMTTPIDMTHDAEYYIMVDDYVHRGISKDQAPRIYITSTTTTNNGISFGYFNSNDASNNVFSKTLPRLTANENIANSPYSASFKGINYSGLYTMVVHVSARETEPDVLRFRIFSNANEEMPSWTPKYWDNVIVTSAITSSNLNLLKWMNPDNSGGNAYTERMDNFMVYKASPIKVTSSAPTELVPTAGRTLTIQSIPAQNILNHDQSLVSAGWYDGDGNLLSQEMAYTIPANMIDKTLTAKVVVKDESTNEITTYTPFTQRVQDYMFADCLYITNAAGSGPASTNYAVDQTVRFYARIARSDAVAKAGTAGIVVAQYAQDGSLKRVISPTKASLNTPAINNANQVYADVPITTANTVSGDRYKAFVWYSNGATTTNGFVYDVLKPIPFNKDSTVFDNYLLIP